MAIRMSEENNFAYLTVSLTFLLLAAALVEQFAGGFGRSMIEAATVLTLAGGVWSIKAKRVWFRAGVGFGVGVLLVVLAGFVLDLTGLRYVHVVILLCFFALTAWLAARQVLFTGPVDTNKVVGAICIYLLLGLIWAMLYLLLHEFAPDSFKGLGSASWQDSFHSLTYFSFVSLTTLGYGDITPVLPVARFLAYMEALVGQFYVAILVASLVGVRVSAHAPSAQ